MSFLFESQQFYQNTGYIVGGPRISDPETQGLHWGVWFPIVPNSFQKPFTLSPEHCVKHRGPSIVLRLLP